MKKVRNIVIVLLVLGTMVGVTYGKVYDFCFAGCDCVLNNGPGDGCGCGGYIEM